MKIEHKVIKDLGRIKQVLIKLLPESDQEKKVLKSATEDDYDVSDQMFTLLFESHIEKYFPNMVLTNSIDTSKYPYQTLIEIQSTKGLG